MPDRSRGYEDRVEYFKYPRAWEEEYRRGRVVEEWWRNCPSQFSEHNRGKRRPGNLQYFAQYALRYLLYRDHGIQSLTWLHLAGVNPDARRRLAAGQSWIRPEPSAGVNEVRTQRQWEVMRAQMGPAHFDVLQESIVRAGFSRHTGEPDLFCYVDGGAWFFAEAKGPTEALLPSQRKWFGIAEGLGGLGCRIRLCRLVPI
jgi:hypothetical protein